MEDLMMKMTACFMTAALVLAGTTASADVVNGDFEADPFDTGWTNSAVTETTGLNGSASAANLAAVSRLNQAVDPLRTFDLTFTFSPTEVAGSRTLNMTLHNDGSDGSSALGVTLNIRSDASGNLQAFDGSGWQTVGAGAFATVGAEYTVQVSANDWGLGGTNTYDLSWSDANSTVLSNSSAGLSFFQFTPTAADGIGGIAFIRGTGNGDYTVDDVSFVPEPGSLALLGLGGLLIARRRRG
jgi:hypothetical protein